MEENAVFARLKGNNTNNSIFTLITYLCKSWGQATFNATTVPEGGEPHPTEVEESGIPAQRVLLCASDHGAEVRS